MLRLPLFAAALALCAGAALIPAAARADVKWAPVPPADLAATPPPNDPDAEAEILEWNAYIDDRVSQGEARNVTRHFKRIKIFNKTGAQDYGTVHIDYVRQATLSDLYARTILPDGTIVPLRGKETVDETLVKERGQQVRRRSFALPGVVPGCVVEYQYTLTQADVWSNDLEFDLQQEIPVRHVVYHIAPIDLPGYKMAFRAFNTRIEASPRQIDGYWLFVADSLPAFREEPLMPPERQVRAWMLLHYRSETDTNGDSDPEKFWREYGHEAATEFEEWTHPNNRLRALAAGLAPATLGDSLRVAALFDSCRARFRILASSDKDTLDLAGMKLAGSPEDVLKQGGGTVYDTNRCFAALARAAGFEARLVRLSPKTWLRFRPEYAEAWFLRDSFIAVHVGASWKAYDLGARYLPPGMVEWEEEGQIALLCSRDSSEFVITPASPPERSTISRVADLTLDAGGELAGQMRIAVTGHLNERVRWDADGNDDLSLVRELKSWAGIDVDPAAWDSARVVVRDASTHQLVVELPVRWPARAGGAPAAAPGAEVRQWIEPGSVVADVGGRLTGSDRKLPISFPHAWCERDTLRIALPKGWHTEPIDEPRPIEVTDFARQDVMLRIEPGTGRLLFMRSLDVGTGYALDFPSDSFDGLKRFFDLARDSDRTRVPIAMTASR
jgi:hypothetical protein